MPHFNNNKVFTDSGIASQAMANLEINEHASEKISDLNTVNGVVVQVDK